MDFVLDLASRYKDELIWVGWLSAATLIASATLIPVLASRIPANYFIDHPGSDRRVHSWRAVILTVVRNLLAVLLLIAGVLMLVLPGQGILTILIALFVADLPGKQKLERKLIGHPRLLASINWIRAQRGVVPLAPPGR